MAKTQAVFERHENKFLLGGQQYRSVLGALQQYMIADKYGLHTICSIYFDTEDYQIIQHSIEKPIYKEKFRLRSYGTPAGQDTVFMELKKKFDGVSYKRRMPVTLEEARAYLERGIAPQKAGQIFGEIDWFMQQNGPPIPQVMLCYDRIALFGKEDQELRVTFDASVRWRNHHLDLAKGDYGSLLIGPDQRLMEIKTATALPYWLTGILSENRAYPTSFSKYGTVYQEHLLQEEGVRYAG